ncbi:MAG: GntR family transcriptional regulator [Anaerolineae bacterium]|nr:MAG: GntR family transcriptional regulator [Anaerolineae bacterium]
MHTDSPAKPLYQALVETILEQIRAGRWQPNQRLPSESALCEQYAVGRNTVRRALQELNRLGVVKTVAGVGTFVVDSRLDKTAQVLYGLSDEMAQYQRQVTSRVLEASILSADPFLARRLQVQLGAEVVFLHRVRLVDNSPVAIERAYLPHELCPDILKFDFSHRSLYRVLTDEYGCRPHHADQVIEAELATPQVAELLALQPPAVVFVFHRETRLADDRVIEYVDSEVRADRFRFLAHLRLSDHPADSAFRRLPVLAAERPLG